MFSAKINIRTSASASMAELAWVADTTAAFGTAPDDVGMAVVGGLTELALAGDRLQSASFGSAAKPRLMPPAPGQAQGDALHGDPRNVSLLPRKRSAAMSNLSPFSGCERKYRGHRGSDAADPERKSAVATPSV
jgi:hypothetical protein